MQLELNYKKSTKGTHVYENTDENAAIPTLYIRKSAACFEGFSEAPLILTVTGEVEGE